MDTLQRAGLTGPLPNRPDPGVTAGAAWRGYVAALVGVTAVTALIGWLPGATRIGNISLLYLIVVIGAGWRFGSRPAVLAAILSFLIFDYCFVQPIGTFTVADPSEWLALVMFLLTAGVTGHLTAQLQARARQAERRELEAVALAETSWTIASQVSPDQSLAEVLRRLATLVGSPDAAIVVRDPRGRLCQRARSGTGPARDWETPVLRQAISYVLDLGKPIAWDDDRHHWDKALAEAGQTDAVYVPVQIEYRTLGVLALSVAPALRSAASVRRLVESLANHVAVILERERLTALETSALALTEADRLKTALLSMVSHDFRSPLASIKASAASLLSAGPTLDHAVQQDLLNGVIQGTDRLNRMVGNILSLSRLDADAWEPQTEPTLAAELVEAALESFSAADNRRIQVTMAPDLPAVGLDPVQMAVVLHNLVENALKYALPPTPGAIGVAPLGLSLPVGVVGRGPGVG
ncbi:MAG: DUF4118 domain-containing protein, partial [Candidatus Sericytochromatia bacterium]|nr:DUF4118 domain-containing protein [Candidatus Sericytochromatia bacterium]